MDLLFSFEGRIGRLQWWLAQIVVFVLAVAGVFLIGAAVIAGQGAVEALAAASGVSIVALICLFALTAWINLASSAKRFHDRGRSGWWFLVNFVPYIGSLIVFIELGFFPAKEDNNPYGSRGGNYKKPSLDSLYDEIAEAAPRIQYAAPEKIAVPTTPSMPSNNAQRPSFGRRA